MHPRQYNNPISKVVPPSTVVSLCLRSTKSDSPNEGKHVAHDSKFVTMAIAHTSERKPRRTSNATLKEKSDKPKRPLSAYNLFFKYQREKILRTASQPLYKPRRSHGKIGFADLARSVADEWKALDESAKKEFHERAATEKEVYERELEVWNHARVLSGRCSTPPVTSGIPVQTRDNLDFVYSKSSYSVSEVSDDDIQGRWSFDNWLSHFDDECFLIMSALKKG